MIELPLLFVAGTMGTAHCLGMCGPLVLSIGASSRNWRAALPRQLAYNTGRVFSYAALGAAAGYCGARLAAYLPAIANVPAVLAIAAGAILFYQGLLATGWLSWRGVVGTGGPCLAGGFVGQFLREGGMTGVFLAGVFTGFLPCGLLYGMLALATSSGSPWHGMAAMAAFGLGTSPVMLLAGMSGSLIGLSTRRRLYAAAAWCLVLTGIVSTARGVSFLSLGSAPVAGCPMCAPENHPTP